MEAPVLTKQKTIGILMKNPNLAIRELNNRSLFRFLKFVWPEISNEEFQPNWHIEYMCDQLQALAESVAEQRSKSVKESINDLIINVPPGSTKTTTVSIVFPAWCWTKWYWMKFIALSYSATLSLESAEKHRDLIRSDLFQQVYPDLSIKMDKEGKGNFQVQKEFPSRPGYARSIRGGGSRYSTSVGGTLTGFHAHIILVDDPINPDEAVSPVKLPAVNRWMDQTLPTRKIHKICSPIVTIMQRLHEDDPTGHKLAKKKKNITHICLPGEIRERDGGSYRSKVRPRNLIKRYSEDGLLDPIRMTYDVLDDMRVDLGEYGYAGQVGQSPSPPTGGMFKTDRFQIIDYPPDPKDIISVVRYWDKAGTAVKKGQKKSNGPAWTAGVKMAKLRDGTFVILNVVRGRWDSNDREAKIKQTTEADGQRVRVGVEQEPGSGGKESAEATVRNLAGFLVYKDRPTGDKVLRADTYSVQVNDRNVKVVQAEWNKDFIEEHTFFPNGRFKDQVDATSGAFAMLTKKKQARTW